MAIWQTKSFDEAPAMIDGQPCGYFSGSFFADSGGEIVEIDVKIDYGTRAGDTIRLSEPTTINRHPNALFRALRDGLEYLYRDELLALRNEIERKTEKAIDDVFGGRS